MDRGTKITLIIVALVAILAFSQSLTGGKLTDLVSNRAKAAAAANGVPASEAHGQKKVELPKPAGNPSAPVKVRVFVTSDNTCDTSTIKAMEKLTTKYPGKVYVEYADLLNEKVKKEADRVKIGCKSGLTINGKNRFFIPSRGLNGTIMFDGPVGQKNYRPDDVEAVIELLLHTHAKGAAKGSGTGAATKNAGGKS
jgi:hypothetical protein